MSVETAERIVGEILREASGLEWSDIDRDATFLELGFDSLFLIQFSESIRSACSVKLSIRELLETVETPAALVAYLPTQPDWTVRADAPTPEIQVAAPSEPTAPCHASQTVVVEPRILSPTPRIAASHLRESVSTSGIEAVLLGQQRIMERQLEVLAGLQVKASAATRFEPETGNTPKEPAKKTLLSLVPSAASGGSVKADRFRCIDEIQPEGDRTPLFCMPAADGLTVIYHELSGYFGADQPIYGLNSPGIAGEELPQTLEALATRFVEEIRDVQPKGPYLLAGYCSGGTLALEAAQQLGEAGEQVAMLALIETYNWLDAPSTNPTRWVSGGYQLQRVYFHLRNFLLLSARKKVSFLRSKLTTLRRRVKIWRQKFFGRARPGRGPVLHPAIDMAELWRAHELLARMYETRPYPGKLLLFRPRRDYRCHRSTEFEATEGLVIKRMRAFPAGLMADPFAEDLARELEEAIQNGIGGADEGDATGSGDIVASSA